LLVPLPFYLTSFLKFPGYLFIAVARIGDGFYRRDTSCHVATAPSP